MKYKNVIMSAAKNLLMVYAAFALFSCEKTPEASIEGDREIDEEAIDGSAIIIKTDTSSGNTVEITLSEGDRYITNMLYAETNNPVEVPRTIRFSTDTSLVAEYSKRNGKDYHVLPQPFYSFDNGNTLTLNSYESETLGFPITVYAINPLGNMLPAGEYLLPVVAESFETGMHKVIYLKVSFTKKFKGEADLYTGPDCFLVFYLNTSDYDPRLVTDYYMSKINMANFETEWYCAIGNIVNLRKITLDYDADSGRAILNLGSDMRYLLQHFDTYLKPVFDTGRKVCLSIEGSGKGIGFCNLSDEQIEDFVSQVKEVMNAYPFDGINLWDRNSGYGKEGLPAMNTTSYPKLIKSLREALGSDKLLTLTDYEEPTEYFWDTDATGGIEVGQYLDYAWSGYNNGDEPVQIVDPYHQGLSTVSTKYPRKPMAGLSADKYGCLNIAWYTLRGNSQPQYENINTWVQAGYQANKVYVYEDIITYLQGTLEAGDWTPDKSLISIGNDQFEFMYEFDLRYISNLPNGRSGYGKWLKNW